MERIPAAAGMLDETALVRVSLITASYEQNIASANAVSTVRTQISFAIVTMSLLLLGWYHNLVTASSAAAGYDILRDFVPATGTLLCTILMMVGEQRYQEERRYTAAALQYEKSFVLVGADGEQVRGAAEVRAENFRSSSWWLPTRTAIAGGCSLIAWMVIFISHFS